MGRSPLTSNDLRIIDLMLTVDFPGVDVVRAQVPFVEGGERFEDTIGGDCGPVLVVPPHVPRALSAPPVVVMETRVVGRATPPHEVLLHVHRGALDALEFVTFDEPELGLAPDVSTLGAPRRVH